MAGGRTLPLQIPDIRETRRILSSAARNADHGRGATDVSAGRASGHRTRAGLGLLPTPTASPSATPATFLLRSLSPPPCRSANGSRTSTPTAKIARSFSLRRSTSRPTRGTISEALDPPFCLAVSAKRYVLFNRQNGSVVVRKASGHGLGHLMAPYDEPTRRAPRAHRTDWRAPLAGGPMEGDHPRGRLR